mgnify:FL=1|jgi:disulfide bond formation protein DsbB
MDQIKYKKTLTLILLFSVFALITAYFIQYVLGHQPCNLCLIERVPFVSAIIVTLFCLISKKSEKIVFLILALIFFFALLISLYHYGIEQELIKESLVCDLKNGNETLTAEELLRELKKKTVSCKDVTFKIMGFSLATINAITSLALSAITFKIYLYYEKNK